MTYHAISIAKHGGRVDLIGYLGETIRACLLIDKALTCDAESSPHPDVTNNPNINIVALPTPPRKPGGVPFLLFAPFKVVFQVYHLLWLLSYELRPAQWLLVQNPPSIPTLAIASFVCYLRNTRLMIDWHNYGWTILAGTRGARHPLVWLSRLYEAYLGRAGFFHLTVTDAMARQLRGPPYRIGAPMMPVHDRPAEIFQPIGVTESGKRKKILESVVPQKELVPRLLDGSMRLVVSSTSWTPDEDFGLLLDALVRYANPSDEKSSDVPTPVLALITGKGPQKEIYLEKIAALTKAGRLPNVVVATAFLPFELYAGLLACANLGVCLHRSSSGVDLPMKVVDMFGAGLPVAAYSGYESFGELVREGVNGRGFETAEKLADILTRLLGKDGQAELQALRRGAVTEGSRRWDEEWESTVGVILGLVGR
jgi:beta-1,4-mannosyltransferase